MLSGGGCRGFAHLGAVKALQECGIYPAEISGTSSGAVAGAFLANGFLPDEIKDIFIEKLKLNILSRNEFKLRLISMKNIRIFLQKIYGITNSKIFLYQMERLGEPNEIAAMVAFILSDLPSCRWSFSIAR